MKTNKKRYWSVTCKCGHTGSRKTYIPIKFAVIASTGKEAAEKGRLIPRCKHHHKDCILGVEEITYSEFQNLCKSNLKDPFLHCKNIQEQKQFDLSDRIVQEEHYEDNRKIKFEREERKHPSFYKKTNIKNPKKFIRFNNYYEEAYSY